MRAEKLQEALNGMRSTYSFTLESEPINEAEGKSISIIKELIKTSWSGDNNSQGKAIQLLRGLAFSDEDAANKFMKALDKFTDGLKVDDF